jgi:uncharacterized DUF497 family protein
MRIREFEWDEKNEDHIAEHGVAPFEAEELFLYGRPHFQQRQEEKYAAYGRTGEGRYLVVIFAIKGTGLVRVVTARDMTEKEKHFYKKRKGGEIR